MVPTTKETKVYVSKTVLLRFSIKDPYQGQLQS